MPEHRYAVHLLREHRHRVEGHHEYHAQAGGGAHGIAEKVVAAALPPRLAAGLPHGVLHRVGQFVRNTQAFIGFPGLPQGVAFVHSFHTFPAVCVSPAMSRRSSASALYRRDFTVFRLVDVTRAMSPSGMSS